MFTPERTIIVSLETGSYTEDNLPNERFNFKKEKDGKFYGYCPPRDKIKLSTHFGCKSNIEFIEGILVIYVKSAPEKKTKIISGFAPNSTIYATPQLRNDKSRFNYIDMHLTYSIVSDSIYDLSDFNPRLDFKLDKPALFRAQRIYGINYIEFTKNLINLIEPIYEDDDNQELIQSAIPLSGKDLEAAIGNCPKFTDGGRKIVKNPAIAKAALQAASYICAIDPNHSTFPTKNGNQYMEAHHLIPCSTINTKTFWTEMKINLDRIENIVCLCPNCHRAIHYGNKEIKNQFLHICYEKHKHQLSKAGLKISENELISKYY